jgi:hypothetical protein
MLVTLPLMLIHKQANAVSSFCVLPVPLGLFNLSEYPSFTGWKFTINVERLS